MLRITESESGGVNTICLEGKLFGPWVDELRSIAPDATKIHRIDVSHVTYVDFAGTQLLAELRACGVEIIRPSRFLAQLLNLESK
jgi:ABC-type transporter Mla MlaB component